MTTRKDKPLSIRLQPDEQARLDALIAKVRARHYGNKTEIIKELIGIFPPKAITAADRRELAGLESEDVDEPQVPTWILAPVYGEIVMGDPDETSQDPVEHIPIMRSQLRKGQYILRTYGDSMLPKFEPGDLVLVDNTIEANPGDFVAVLFNGKTTLKQLLRDKLGRFVLHPLNSPKHKDRIVSEEDEFSVQGVVLDIVRRKVKK